jgi:signal transduction histidine kinase
MGICESLDSSKNENNQSKIRIANLEFQLAKANVIDNIQKEKNQIQEELSRATSYNHHLSNIISGLNHELSPWITGIHMLANRLHDKEYNSKNRDALHKIEMAAIQTNELLSNLSKSINKVKNFSVFKSNIKDTVASWIQIVLLERDIKEKISQENITVDLESLNFEAEHSPMYVSQVILNLAKNSIDHNSHMLETLKIKIYGDKKLKYLIYEDNGKGIPQEILSKVFNNFGVTTKTTESGEIHGFGLYSCLNYCISMRAIIVAKSIPNSRTRFIIKFERIDDDNQVNESTSGVYSRL